MASFEVPFVPPNPSSWGPPASSGSENNKFHLLPYAPFGRADRLGRAADFTQNSNYGGYQRQDRRRFGDDSGKNADFQYKVDAEEMGTFQLVDTSKQATSQKSRFTNPTAKRRQHQARLRQLNARRTGGVAELDANKGRYNMPQRTKRNRNNFSRGGGRGGWGGRGGRGRGGWQQRVDRQASVSVKADWVRVDEYDLGKLTKTLVSDQVSASGSSSKNAHNSLLPQAEEDLLWCGFVDKYNDSYDKVSARTSAPLKRNETKEFYPVTTTDDPVIEKLAIDGVANVFATDAILAHLMTCPRSVYPWDIVVQKLPGGTLFFDKRDAGQFDYLSVNETSNNPPAPIKADDDPQGVNTPERLSLEATMINQNFTQQILSSQVKKNRKHFDLPNPFFDEDDAEGMEPASVAYRYRKFDLGNDVNLVCRTELHGIVPQNKKKGDAEDEEEYMTAFALNEIHPFSKATPGGPPVMNWRDKIDSQRGAVLATELKNNSFKLAKWTAQSILAGATQMKIGFVSRTSPKNAYEHVILGTQFYRPKEFATQITLSEQGMWAIIRFLISVFEKQPTGKFVIMRDPNKAILRIFRVPPGTFEEEDEDGEEEETNDDETKE